MHNPFLTHNAIFFKIEINIISLYNIYYIYNSLLMHSTITTNVKYFLHMVYLDNKLKNIFKNSKYFIKETQKGNYPY